MKRSKVLITGIFGQCGQYLANKLKDKYEVWGLYRNHANDSDDVVSGINYISGDITDYQSLYNVIDKIKPDYIYNAAGFSHIGRSFDQPELVLKTNAVSVLYFLEIIKSHFPTIKLCQFSSYEIFAGNLEMPVKETSFILPVSPYSIGKAAAHNYVQLYRKQYGLFASSVILGNSESPKRGIQFVTRKITNHVAQLVTHNTDKVLELGYLDAKRDWGSVDDYMDIAIKVLEDSVPDDYMLCTGQYASVRDVVVKAFQSININIRWNGQGILEKGYDKATNELLITINPDYYRPTDVPILYGSPEKAMYKFNWTPNRDLDGLIHKMVYGDIAKYDNSPLKTHSE